MPAIRRILAVLCCAFAPVAFGVSRVALVHFERLSIPPDVPAHLCSAIAQDHSGFLWFGTQGGLVRFDGYDFRVFHSDSADASTLGGNYVRSLLVASDGRIWVGTFSGGLSVFNPATGKFTRYRHDAANPQSISYDRIEGLAETRDGAIWIASNGGLDRLDPRRQTVTHFRHDANNPRSLADDRARGLLVDRAGRLWVGTRDGLQRRAGEGQGFERIGFAGQFVTRLFEDSRGRIWIGTEENGAAVLDPRSGVVHAFPPRPADPNGLSHYWVYGFAEAAPGEMWIATFGGGIDVVDEGTLAIINRLHPDPLLDDTLADDRIGAIFRDATGVTWVGTWGEGIARHDPRTRAFRSLRFSPNRPDGLTHRAAVRALEMRDGSIWVGTNGNGIDIFDSDLHRVGGHRADVKNPSALADGGITCLSESADGTVWVATLNSMLHRLRPGSTRFDRVAAERLPGGPIRTIAFTGDGFLWAGAAEGMARVNPKTLETRLYKRWPGAAKSSPAIESIVATASGDLWIGTDNGLYAFDPRTESATRIARDPSRGDALPENWVPDLMIARDGRLWAGTSAGGAILVRWDGKSAHFQPVSSSPAEALIEDASGAVWIGPRLKVDPHSLTTRTFGPTDGIEYRNFFIASRSRTRDGRLLFGSPEGLLIVDPSEVPGGINEEPIVATALRVEGKERAGADVLHSLVLSSRERTFTVDVAALDFEAASGQRYRYRLDGLDTGWIVAGPAQRSITYSRIPPGHYTLRVNATSHNGGWSSRELRLPVSVVPAFYQTALFRIFAVFVFAALLYGLYRLRVRQLRARQLVLERTVAERTRELSLAYAKIEEASLTDPLTQLRNRRYLEQTIDSDLQLAKRSGSSLVVLLVDLDHFKSVNDTYGHAGGDAVLTELAHVLKQSVRASDVVVRWGGEEFLLVIRFVDRTAGPDLAEKVRAAVEGHEFPLPSGERIRRTCSIGLAVWPVAGAEPDHASFDHVIDRADAALYEAKRAGRNRVVDGSAAIALA